MTIFSLNDEQRIAGIGVGGANHQAPGFVVNALKITFLGFKSDDFASPFCGCVMFVG